MKNELVLLCIELGLLNTVPNSGQTMEKISLDP